MPGYRGHLVGGLAVYVIMLYLLYTALQPTPMMAAELLAFTLIGSLFPDIDIKSKGQKVSYLLMLGLCGSLLLHGYFELVAVLGVLSLVPMLTRHRGLFHRLWFITLFALTIALICSVTTSMSCRALLFDALFFMLGALSHLWLDFGFRRIR